MNLKELLKKEKRTRWLDVGNGETFEEGFFYLDILPKKKKHEDKSFQKDITKLSNKDLLEMGKFDLVRLQHTLEHVAFEDTDKALTNCAKLLKKDGYLLITTPDLRVHIDTYLSDKYRKWEGFKWWAHQRIPPDSPKSFYFSIFAHSIPQEPHKLSFYTILI